MPRVMKIRAWTYDIAREQSPSLTLLRDLADRSLAAGYNLLGLYLEHRFAYPSASFAAGPGCVSPEMARTLCAEYRPRGLRIVPFLNSLGHMEGFIRAEGGQWLAEGPAPGRLSLQICPSRPECVEFVRGLLADAIAAFDDPWLHLGGDEAWQLGECPRCAERAGTIGKAGLYAEHYAPLCRWVLEQGRRPCLWADMLLQHPEALAALPRETVLFDWQYDHRPRESTAKLRAAGFDVVCCPSVQTYNSGWCFLDATQRNIDEHAEDARAAGALGVCVTTWELTNFTNYPSVWPVIFAAGRRISSAPDTDWPALLAQESDARWARAAQIVGHDIPAAAPFIRAGTWRTLRDRLVMKQNPFYLWQDWRTEACGPPGDEILRLCTAADELLAADDPLRGAVELHRAAVEWVRAADRAAVLYRGGAPGFAEQCIDALQPGREALERLIPWLMRAETDGGSRADIERHMRLVDRIAVVCDRIESVSNTAGPYRPAFETLIHDAFVLGDQAAWRTGAYR